VQPGAVHGMDELGPDRREDACRLHRGRQEPCVVEDDDGPAAPVDARTSRRGGADGESNLYETQASHGAGLAACEGGDLWRQGQRIVVD